MQIETATASLQATRKEASTSLISTPLLPSVEEESSEIERPTAITGVEVQTVVVPASASREVKTSTTEVHSLFHTPRRCACQPSALRSRPTVYLPGNGLRTNCGALLVRSQCQMMNECELKNSLVILNTVGDVLGEFCCPDRECRVHLTERTDIRCGLVMYLAIQVAWVVCLTNPAIPQSAALNDSECVCIMQDL